MSSRIKDDVNKIFEFWCEVNEQQQAPPNGHTPTAAGRITECFPKSFNDDRILSEIPAFAYPCEFENTAVQAYSFVLTSDDSKFRFGFCRHDPKTRSAMVIITYLPWHDTFLKLLAILNDLKRKRNGEFESFLSEAYNKGIPEPGSCLKLFYNAGQNHFTFQRPSQLELPSIPENQNLSLYYNFVDPKNMIAVFAAMLSEHRIIFTSRRLDRLSSCIQAASAFLYPMVWQHIFIPILPMKLKDFLCAPMPYLIGVPEAVLRTMSVDEMGEVVILNCDTNEFRSPFDDIRQMPPELIYQMKKHLNNSNELIGDRISRIFLRVLVQLIGGYRDAAKYSQGEKISWDRETFIESRPPHLRQFLSRMMELQIFQQFIDERLDILNSGQGISDEFEMETLRYMDKMNKKGKNYREFLRNVKDKTNPAVKSAVKSVKEGSRGVKSAYKDLKSKFRDITPPKSQFHVSQSTLSNNSQHISGGQKQNHHSAPSSPVFPNRNYPLDKSFTSTTGGETRNGHQLTFCSQQTTVNHHNTLHDFSSNQSSMGGNRQNYSNNNSHMVSSPTISPTNSLRSSEMNIAEELEDHPLFKTPIVDRSLKPSNSLDCSSTSNRCTPRLGAPTKIPFHNNNQETTVCLNSDPFHTASNDISRVCSQSNLTPYPVNRKMNAIVATNSIFDSPPDIPCPPVPPRRTGGSFAYGNNKSQTNSRKANTELNLLQFDSIKSKPKGHEEPSALRKTQYCGEKSVVQPNESLDTTISKDLISLDESNSSLDISDFDPLNQNAKLSRDLPPIKPLNNFSAQRVAGTTTFPTTITASGNSISNPLYPFFSPTYKNRLEQLRRNETDDTESDLLRQYGLDRLTNGVEGPRQAQQTQSFGQSNWTTFD